MYCLSRYCHNTLHDNGCTRLLLPTSPCRARFRGKLQEVFIHALPCASHPPAAFCRVPASTTCSFLRLSISVFYAKRSCLSSVPVRFYQFFICCQELFNTYILLEGSPKNLLFTAARAENTRSSSRPSLFSHPPQTSPAAKAPPSAPAHGCGRSGSHGGSV